MRLTLLMLLITCAPAMAQVNYRFECSKADAEPAIVAVKYSRSGSPVPCEVNYTVNGNTEALWSASVKSGYCEAKAEAFIKQQRQLGWRCVKQGK